MNEPLDEDNISDIDLSESDPNKSKENITPYEEQQVFEDKNQEVVLSPRSERRAKRDHVKNKNKKRELEMLKSYNKSPVTKRVLRKRNARS